MKNQAREVQYFLFSQYFSDGLRITLGVLLPCLLLAQLNHFETGLVVSLGALCVSITDFPGPVVHKRNAMLLCNLAIFLVALTTGFARMNPFTLGAEIFFFCFLFSMLAVYGTRAGAIGTAALVVMILTLDNELKPLEVFGYSALILAGGIWYMLLSLLTFTILPYRQAQQALGECMHEVARFLRFRADFYRPGTNLEADYRKVVEQQIVVNEKQDAVREVLFKSRQFIKGSSPQGRLLVLTFADLVDLYEQITTTHYDYSALREKFGSTHILSDIARFLSQMADQLDDLGFSIQANRQFRQPANLKIPLENLQEKIDQIGKNDQELSTMALQKILVNLRNLVQRLQDMQLYFNPETGLNGRKTNSPESYARFVSHQEYDLKILRSNLNFRSVIFKHAVRVALVCLFGYLVTKIAPYGHHSYWVLLTIIVILKPAFSLTKQRNYQRIVGTLAGGGIGILILYLIPNQTIQFAFLLLFMVLNFSFQRRNYVVSVIFMTPFVLILFNLLGNSGTFNLVQERIIDTLIGSSIAFAASYFIFPSWESEQLTGYLKNMLMANAQYLQKLAELLAGKTVSPEEYKLARKQVYVSSANLSAAFQRMASEPKSRQKKSAEVQEFLVLNHILYSFIATVASGLVGKTGHNYPATYLKSVNLSCALLHEAAELISPTGKITPVPFLAKPGVQAASTEAPPEALQQNQLEFILKVSADIRRITETIVAEK